MKQFIKLLQHPLLKIVLSPLGYVAFGLIAGMGLTLQIKWPSIGLLYLIVTSSHLIEHYFFIKHSKKRQDLAPTALLYICEVILIASSVVFFLQQHWIINLLLSLYIIFIHVQYVPYKITGTFYHFLLTVFFHGFILNSIAVYTQINGITLSILYAFIPIVIWMIGTQLETMQLRHRLTRERPSKWLKISRVISSISSIIAVGAGVYFSLPSSTYFLVQLLFIFVSGLIILPMFVPTEREKQIQNKINYYNAATLIFSLLYGLSFIF